MSIDVRQLSGARASSAVRCIARAEWEGLGAEKTDTPAYLLRAFKRGGNVGKAWALDKQAELAGHDLEIEAVIPWGPPELAWRGHADLVDHTDKVVYECYHAADGSVRDEKVAQVCLYADNLGPEYTAELAVVNTSKVDEDEGFEIATYAINVDTFRDKVRDIQARVAAAVMAGEVNPADKVGDTPFHSECRSCPFAEVCWQGWRPPEPESVQGAEDTFVALRITDSDRHHAKAALARIEERRADLIEQIAYLVPANESVTCGDVTVRHTVVKGGTTFSLTDATKAGHSLPAELEAFTKPRKGYDKWEVVGP